jgi:hypothetical protein
MRKTVITVGLGEKEINRAIQELNRYKQEFLKREKRLVEGLAEIGLKEASVRFTTAMYDGTNDVSVHLDEISNGYAIVADGKAVAFIEFGAGVYHNGSEPYPNPRPDGIVGIGEYGKGHGKRKAWGYLDENDELVITRGNPAAMPMWYASEEIKSSVLKVVREVFG